MGLSEGSESPITPYLYTCTNLTKICVLVSLDFKAVP